MIEHVVRGRWSALEREQQIKAGLRRETRARPGNYEVGVEQEPGSGGKEIGGEHDPQLLASAAFCRQGHRLEGGPRRAVCSASAGRQCLAHRRHLADYL